MHFFSFFFKPYFCQNTDKYAFTLKRLTCNDSCLLNIEHRLFDIEPLHFNTYGHHFSIKVRLFDIEPYLANIAHYPINIVHYPTHIARRLPGIEAQPAHSAAKLYRIDFYPVSIEVQLSCINYRLLCIAEQNYRIAHQLPFIDPKLAENTIQTPLTPYHPFNKFIHLN